jgi:hypothetical protein
VLIHFPAGKDFNDDLTAAQHEKQQTKGVKSPERMEI